MQPIPPPPPPPPNWQQPPLPPPAAPAWPPPATGFGAPSYAPVGGRSPFTPLRAREPVIIVIAVLMILCELAEAGIEAMPKTTVQQLLDGLVALGHVALLIGLAIAFLMWVYRAHANTPSFWAEGLTSTPGWAVGYYFIPFLSLYKPYVVMSEMWRASLPSVDSRNAWLWQQRSAPPVVGAWWLCFVLWNALALTVTKMQERTPDGSAMDPSSYWFAFVHHLLAIAGLVLMVLVVRGLNRLQYEKEQTMRTLEAQMAAIHLSGQPQ